MKLLKAGVWAGLVVLAACDSGTGTPAAPVAPAPVDSPTVVVSHDDSPVNEGYSTLERVGYVLNCMSGHGGQTVENLYGCSCRLDHIAANMNFSDFDHASTYRRYRRMPGEKGGVYRESAEGDVLLAALIQQEEAAAEACPLVQNLRAPAAAPTKGG